jgi:hypothetical protein
VSRSTLLLAAAVAVLAAAPAPGVAAEASAILSPLAQPADPRAPLFGFNEGYAQRLPAATYAERELHAREASMFEAERDDPAAVPAALDALAGARAAFDRAQARDDERLRAVIADSRAAGAEVARLGIVWAQVEPRPGRFDWTYYDGVYQRLLAHGIRPLPVLLDSPQWAHPSRLRAGGSFVSWHPDPGFEPEWERFAAAVAERYPESVAIEVWNEPNSSRFWGAAPDPRRYTELLASAYRGIKRVRPQMPVLLAGMAPRMGKAVQWDRFLRRAYELGAADHSDDLSLHPYATEDGRQIPQVLDQVRVAEELIREQHPGARIWVTELGFPTHPRARNAVSELRQAELLSTVYRRLRGKGVRAILIHRVREVETGNPTEDSYGVTRIDGERKPGFCALVVSLWVNRLC